MKKINDINQDILNFYNTDAAIHASIKSYLYNPEESYLSFLEKLVVYLAKEKAVLTEELIKKYQNRPVDFIFKRDV
jgi:hypothetical protein